MLAAKVAEEAALDQCRAVRHSIQAVQCLEHALAVECIVLE